MRAYVPAYALRTPRDLNEALELMAREPGAWRPFAGGTDLMVQLEAGTLEHTRYLNLWGLDELRGIEASEEYVTLGALTTYTEILRHPTLQQDLPLLCRAAAETGTVATQNRGTIGGNIANASPAADSPPALLVYDAELEVVSVRGARWIPYGQFHTGYKRMDLHAGEIIRRVRLSRRMRGWRQYYRKVGTRRVQAISKVCFAGAADLDGDRIRDLRLALASLAPTVVRCTTAEAALRGRRLDAAAIGEAQAALARDVAPIDDLRSTARYRLRVARNLLAEFLEPAAPPAQATVP